MPSTNTGRGQALPAQTRVHQGTPNSSPRTTVTIRANRAAREGRLALWPEESLALLAAYGITVPAWRVARDPDEAAAAALAVGVPVSLERRDACGRDADPPRVDCLDAADAAAAGAAARLLLADGSPHGVLVRHRPPPARALSVHVADDPVLSLIHI